MVEISKRLPLFSAWTLLLLGQRRTSHKYFRTSTTPPLFFFFFLDAIVLATYQVVFARFVFNQFLSDFKNEHTAAKVL